MMFGSFERMVAGRYLRARRKEGFVSVIAGFSLLGIGLGVATLIIVMAVMNGYRQDIMDRILGVNGHIDVRGVEFSIPDYDLRVDAIKNLPGVVAVMPQISGQVMATSQGVSSGALVRGVRGEDLAARTVISENIVQGSLPAFARGEGLMIGVRMAERFRVNLGDSLTLISPKGNVTAFGTAPRLKDYPIVALFDVGMSDFDSSIIFMPLNLAQTYFKYPDSVTGIEIQVADPDQARFIAREVAGIAGPGVRVLSWEQTNSTFFNALQVERNVMFLILTLIIVVAAFNIIAGLIMLVKDKGRDIAILRTMGATRGMIMRVFFLAGASVGVTGTLLGLILGILFCENIESVRQVLESITGTNLFSAEIYFLSTIPAEMDWGEVASVVMMGLGLSFAATLYPSWRAANTDPVEALRYE
ncbi:MAG: lipoprotein-releasing ABC transporter permease subunit [Rhodospirillaceae bacterium]|nr:lipoprotein-releasing ABC transporter permease subunit [Rhodospirillaceae bacterium]MBT5564148.1 lipoprotein-releasing ABC transporter permease subunit [Rhodospirillaceae bacterium]MBT6089943.1 lipoprotein-releasing ABC transporter permease subunit [Rhodospirillaceae bacterium]MBT6961012.1 lipoprotein-releasing ABC transporter permease subunit [Rhodospirillaceae bacterium]